MWVVSVLMLCICTVTVFSNPESRIFNGKKAVAGQFPYHAGLFIKGSQGTARCGGALIAKNVVITAAHCVVDLTAGKVSLGSTQYAKGTIVDMKSVVVHESYDEDTDDNDIALIILGKDVTPDGKNIEFIGISTEQLGENESVTISGYGSVGDGPSSNDLLYVDLHSLPQTLCKKYFPVGDSAVCCQGPSKESACEGDSGGPLVKVGLNGKLELVGLVSYGPESCEKGFPQVYTRVASFKKWIDDELAKL